MGHSHGRRIGSYPTIACESTGSYARGIAAGPTHRALGGLLTAIASFAGFALIVASAVSAFRAANDGDWALLALDLAGGLLLVGLLGVGLWRFANRNTKPS